MKALKIVTSILIVCGIIFLSLSCSSKSTSTTTTTTKTATVTKGTLSVSITGTGNLAYSTTQDLAFEVPGYVESVSVKTGDTVKEGQEIAKVDTSEWDKTLKSYQSTLTKAQRALNDSQATLASKTRDVSAKELAVQQAQLDLQTSEYNLSQIADVKTAQANVDGIQTDLTTAQSNLRIALANGYDTTLLYNQIASYNDALAQANKRLLNIENGKDLNITSSVALQVAQDTLAVTQKQKAVADAQAAVDTANTAVKNAQLDLADAAQSVKDSQSDLDEANKLSPIIKAPFAGIITSVNSKGGDEVFKGTIAVTIADPSQFEADIFVTENDIFSVKVGGEATVSLDALSDLTFPAKVTYIAPTATVSSGVVNYSVTVTLTSLQPITNTPTISGQSPAQSSTRAIPTLTSSSGSTASTSTATASSSQSVTLKKGLSATVKIISEQASNVLIVPSKAIKQQGQNSTVQVVNGTTTETVIVKTGITDGTNTEITEGLSEKQQVVYTVSTSSSSSTSKTTQGVSGLGGISGAGGPPPGGF
jgi:multidrug efflux pump subunit AcrA (membrane-fusion protein)